MDILFTKLSDQQHRLTIRRHDGSEESAELNSRSFLRHDLAHLAVELEVPLARGFWSQIAAGAALDSKKFAGDIKLAESLAGPVQTLMRIKAGKEQFLNVLQQVQPALASDDLAGRIRERGRQLQGHWQATAFGEDMHLIWPENRSLHENAA